MKNNNTNDLKSQQKAWYLYDWAISAFTTTVTTVFLGPYLTTIAQNSAVDGYINIFGMQIFADSYFSYCISLSVILQVFLLPLLGAFADFTKKKKFLLGFFAYMGALATIGFYFLDGNRFLLGGILLIISNIAAGASMVFYNAFLSDISDIDDRDRVSSNGFAWGYLGGGILLALNLALVMNAEALNIGLGDAVKISLASAGLWWAIFTIFPMLKLKSSSNSIKLPQNSNIFTFGFKQIYATIKDAVNYPKTLLFILAYIFYNDGIQSVIVVSSQFGQEELGLDISTLTTVILLVQFVAYFGAKFFNFLADKYTTKVSLAISLSIWVFIILYAFLILNSEIEFYIIGMLIGLVLGGSQALSRSLYSLMIPKNRESEYFSLYEISDRGTSWIGPLVFGLSLQFTSSYRLAIASLIIFFVVGLILLIKVDIKKAILEAGNS